MDKSLPNLVRVKRKVTEDPLLALIFKLARTDSEIKYEDSRVPDHKEKAILLSNDESEKGKSEDELPEELADMVNQYLKLETNDTKKIKRPRRLNEKSALANEFVYDVYYREASSGPVIDTNVGVIRFEQEDLDLLHQEDDELSDYGLRSDDEDSNAEDFYRNDYPDNEDDDKGIVIGNEDEWYSDEEYDKPNQDYLKWQEEEQPQGNKGFEGLSLEEVEHLYQEFYNENNAGEEQ